jgi:hypothetical protein
MKKRGARFRWRRAPHPDLDPVHQHVQPPRAAMQGARELREANDVVEGCVRIVERREHFDIPDGFLSPA